MALSTTQTFRILRLLCYPRGTTDSTSMDFSNIISGKLSSITGDAQVEVEKLLEWIDEIEDQLDKSFANAGVKRIDDIEFFGNDGPSKVDLLRKEKSKYLNELAIFIGIANRCSGSSMGCVVV